MPQLDIDSALTISWLCTKFTLMMPWLCFDFALIKSWVCLDYAFTMPGLWADHACPNLALDITWLCICIIGYALKNLGEPWFLLSLSPIHRHYMYPCEEGMGQKCRWGRGKGCTANQSGALLLWSISESQIHKSKLQED
jgi:hypothetical protein